MQPSSEEISRIMALLTQAPIRLEAVTRSQPTTRLTLQTDAEPWSVSDILAHLRACSDVWGATIIAMITKDNPIIRYVSPRSSMSKPKYQKQEFVVALESFSQERHQLVETLAKLDEAGWMRCATLNGVSPRQPEQTVLNYAERIVSHEQPHLDQIEALLR
ncbi:MAG: DinB family protein [Caldilineaceae bacterium]